jgi:hypothetical protein
MRKIQPDPHLEPMKQEKSYESARRPSTVCAFSTDEPTRHFQNRPFAEIS